MKTKLVNLIIILVIFATTLAAILLLPDGDVPTHFGPTGEPDDWGSKYTLLILPASVLLIWILADRNINVFTKNLKEIDEDKAESHIRTNQKAVHTTITALALVMMLLNFVIIYLTFSHLPSYNLPVIDTFKIIAVLIGLMLIFMGNIMPKTRTNSLVGLRCKWTMYNDNTWRKSNFFAGVCSMISGALAVVAGLAFSGIVAVMILFGVMICATVVMLVYACAIYNKEQGNG